MLFEVLPSRFDVTLADAFSDVRIMFEIPFLIDFEIAWPPPLKIARLDKMLPPRFEDTGGNRRGNIGIPGEVPFFINCDTSKQQLYDLDKVVIVDTDLLSII
jgi:hypothetical protein